MSKYDCLRIYHPPYDKKRLGKNNDGGYIICDIGDKYDVFISGGIANDISFELDLLQLYPHLVCHAYDGSIQQLPTEKIVLAPNKDQWIPVRDKRNEWIQIGNGMHPFGTLHVPNFGYPPWGTTKDYPNNRTYIGIMDPCFKLIRNPEVLTWDEAMTKYGNLASIHDVLNHRRIEFYHTFLGDVNNKDSSNLRDYLDKYNDIFMKLDIEGGECCLFEAFSDADLLKIKQLVIEFHSPYQLTIPTRLAKTHWLVHLHPNNVCGTVMVDDINVPWVYECTYIRKNAGEMLSPNQLPVPTPIDQPNTLDNKEIILSGSPYIN
jgi:hypothetical protein